MVVVEANLSVKPYPYGTGNYAGINPSDNNGFRGFSCKKEANSCRTREYFRAYISTFFLWWYTINQTEILREKILLSRRILNGFVVYLITKKPYAFLRRRPGLQANFTGKLRLIKQKTPELLRGLYWFLVSVSYYSSLNMYLYYYLLVSVSYYSNLNMYLHFW